ncbi:MAG: type II toxin-antitoxin system MqsA family antitoxin [candidate division NC10 bacterium]|nr:type II toxin-antitoxin system MqsA family antitoxin [candidate division NC10 bacterium]
MPQRKGAFRISACPACGSAGIRAVQEDWSGSYEGKRYVVRNLRHFHCPQCGEKVYDPSAMRQIQAASPAFAKLQRARKTA